MSFTSTILKIAEYLTPLSTLTSLSAKITEVPLGRFTQFLIKNFIKTFKINLEECADPDITHYKTFNEFFTRKLKEGARIVDDACTAVSPVDGTIGQSEEIIAGRLIQAKGLDYSLLALVGGQKADAKPFDDGAFTCIYLSPSNYHRIHMPMDGKLVKTIHIPGKHFPVGKKNISYMPDLYTKNERLVCFFESDQGPFALVLVGAALVGSIATVWDGTLIRRKGIDTKIFETPLEFKRGQEIALFKYGSTVICLWSSKLGEPMAELTPGDPIEQGEKLIY